MVEEKKEQVKAKNALFSFSVIIKVLNGLVECDFGYSVIKYNVYDDRKSEKTLSISFVGPEKYFQIYTLNTLYINIHKYFGPFMQL